MNFPTYTTPLVDGELTYGFSRSYRKWYFTAGRETFLFPCHGQEQGHKVAHIIVGSFKRCGTLDGLARANITRIIGE